LQWYEEGPNRKSISISQHTKARRAVKHPNDHSFFVKHYLSTLHEQERQERIKEKKLHNGKQ
jgi:hypothetical protein